MVNSAVFMNIDCCGNVGGVLLHVQLTSEKYSVTVVLKCDWQILMAPV